MISASELATLVNEAGVPLKTMRKNGDLPFSDKIARRIFKEGGYTYNRISKRWELADTNEQLAATTAPTDPLQYELFPTLSIAFNDDELHALKQVAQQLISGNFNTTAVAYDSSDIELYERSRKLDKGTRIRKTYVVSEALAARFDAVADRSNIDKSQLLELALSDFLQRYGDD